jgi:hypothetical protein
MLDEIIVPVEKVSGKCLRGMIHLFVSQKIETFSQQIFTVYLKSRNYFSIN